MMVRPSSGAGKRRRKGGDGEETGRGRGGRERGLERTEGGRDGRARARARGCFFWGFHSNLLFSFSVFVFRWCYLCCFQKFSVLFSPSSVPLYPRFPSQGRFHFILFSKLFSILFSMYNSRRRPPGPRQTDRQRLPPPAGINPRRAQSVNLAWARRALQARSAVSLPGGRRVNQNSDSGPGPPHPGPRNPIRILIECLGRLPLAPGTKAAF